MSHSTIDRIVFLHDEYEKFCKAYTHFVYSFHDVETITILSTNDQSELIRIEALTARFERMVDLFLNKVARMIVFCETGSDEGTIRDKLFFLQKLSIISDADGWLDMRTMRNLIAHDYLYRENQEFFEKLEELYADHIIPMKETLDIYMKKWR